MMENKQTDLLHNDMFKQYKRSRIAEMRPVTVVDISDFRKIGMILIVNTIGEYKNLTRVSISDEDLKNGSPVIGDMIARNPANHNDQWLVAEQYFKDNFEAYHTERLKEVAGEECFTDQEVQGVLHLHYSGISSWTDFIAYLNTHAAEYAEHQNRELIAWKESALKVLNEIDLQGIGKEIGVPLGEDISSKILPWIKGAKAAMQ